MSTPRLRALVTSGGTREPIDDVRVLTNVSRGRFGASIARALAARGVETTVLGSRQALDVLASEPPPAGAPLHAVRFDSFADLQRELESLTQDPPDLVFMVAAVADYSPAYQPGKLSSAPDTLTLELHRNPKLLAGLRERCPDACLVGFKLLSGASPADLIAAAEAQLTSCQLDLTVANDLSELDDEEHPLYLVSADDDPIRVEGLRDDVAERLVQWTLTRKAPKVTVTDAGPAPEADAGWKRARELLTFLAQTSLLVPGRPGAASVRAGQGAQWSTASELASLKPEDLVHVSRAGEALESRGGTPPDDAAVHAWLFDHLPGLQALVRCPAGLAIPNAESPLPLQRGVAAEGRRIYTDLAEAAEEGTYQGGSFLLRLADDELLLGLGEGDVARLSTEWAEAHRGLAAALAGIDAAQELNLNWRPILAGPGIVGLEASPVDDVEDWTTLFLLPRVRGTGLGALVLDHLSRRGDTLAVPSESPAKTFFVHRGYTEKHRRGGLAFLIPPSKRSDLLDGGSVCLYDPLSSSVLLGLRLRPPWQDRWSFPGGSVEEGETLLQAALRELKEETGLEAPVAEPWASETITVGSGAGDKTWRVTCFLIPCLGAPDPTPSDECAAEWVPLEEALERELTPGVRRFLRSVMGGVL